MPTFELHLFPRTVRGQVSSVLNGTLFVLLLFFLVYDYRNDRADRLEMKRTALDEQARILFPAIRHTPAPDQLHAYLHRTRALMDDIHTDLHIVAAEIDGRFFFSGISGMAGKIDEVVATRLLQSSKLDEPFLSIGDHVFLVGHYQKGDTVAYVAEDLSQVREAINADLRRHALQVGITLLLGIVIINLVLWFAFQRSLSMLTRAVNSIGSGEIGVQIDKIGAKEFDIIGSAINDMSRALSEVEIARTAQMRKAESIQNSLMPKSMSLAGFATGHRAQPAEDVGGDYHDLIPLHDGGLFCIADVAGHGVSAALVVAIVKIYLVEAAKSTDDPAGILTIINRGLNELNLPDMFVSMFVVRMSLQGQSMSFAGAGHPPALLADGVGRVRELSSNGPLLGLGVDIDWATEQIPFSNQDRLCLFTDGIVEATKRDSNEQFGMNRIREALTATRQLPVEQATDEIMGALADFCEGGPLLDDVTLVIVERQL